jgi:transposase-like protein
MGKTASFVAHFVGAAADKTHLLVVLQKREGKTERDKVFNKMKAAGQLPVSCELRQSKYLNNLIEQNHRFIKRLVKPGVGFWSFETSCGVVRLPRMRFQK